MVNRVALVALLMAATVDLASAKTTPKSMTNAQIQAEIRRIEAGVAHSRNSVAAAKARRDEAHARLCAHRAKTGAAPDYNADTGCDAIRVKVVKP